MSFTTKEFNALITQERGDTPRITAALEAKSLSAVDVLNHYERLLRYLGIDKIRERIRKALDEEHPQSYLGFLPKIRDIFPDGDLREHLLAVHKQYPWDFYTRCPEGIEALFPNDFFRQMMADGIDPFEDDHLFKIFQFNNAARLLDALQGEDLKAGVGKRVVPSVSREVMIGERKDPGFACGGMERNFMEAARQGEGLVRVNEGFLAKLYHSKGSDKAVKVTVLSDATAMTSEGAVVWKDYLYATSQGQHVPIVDAIASGTTDIEIPNLILRPIRPTIGLRSSRVFGEFQY